MKIWSFCFHRILFLLWRADNCREWWNEILHWWFPHMLVIGCQLLPAGSWATLQAGTWGKVATPSVWYSIPLRYAGYFQSNTVLSGLPSKTVLYWIWVVWYHVSSWDLVIPVATETGVSFEGHISFPDTQQAREWTYLLKSSHTILDVISSKERF